MANKEDIEEILDDSPEEAENRKWKNRREMAWGFFWGIFLLTTAALFFIPESKLDKLSDIIIWYYICASGIIGAYFGLNSMEHLKRK